MTQLPKSIVRQFMHDRLEALFTDVGIGLGAEAEVKRWGSAIDILKMLMRL